MAFKGAGLRRDYLARDILFQLLGFIDFNMFLFESTGDYAGALVKKSLELADSLLDSLSSNSGNDVGIEEDNNNIISSPAIVLDADLGD